MKVVSNTTPLIGLASIGRMGLLRDIFGEIYIARAVYDEAVTQGREQGGAKTEILSANWIYSHDVQDRLAVEILLDEMDFGEAETIVLARELGAGLVLMDEKKGRNMLEQLKLNKIGTVGILLKAKQMGLINLLRPELDNLQKRGFSVSQFVVTKILSQADE